jgi:hypothetical protein
MLIASRAPMKGTHERGCGSALPEMMLIYWAAGVFVVHRTAPVPWRGIPRFRPADQLVRDFATKREAAENCFLT